jgi:hypothetical protein
MNWWWFGLAAVGVIAVFDVSLAIAGAGNRVATALRDLDATAKRLNEILSESYRLYFYTHRRRCPTCGKTQLDQDEKGYCREHDPLVALGRDLS